MAMKNLVETECGGSNPLMRVATQLNRDKGVIGFDFGNSQQPQNVADQFVSEFLQKENAKQFKGLHGQERFKMGSLLREMDSGQQQQQQQSGPLLNPILSTRLSETWADEYLSKEVGGLQLDPGIKGDVTPIGAENVQRAEAKWADEFLAETERRLAAFATDPEPNIIAQKAGIGTADQWAAEFASFDPINATLAEADELSARNAMKEEARKLSELMKEDSELNETEFADFIRKLSDTEKVSGATVDKPLAEVWSDAFSQRFSKPNDDTFWDGLAKAWEDSQSESKEDFGDSTEHPWAAEFEGLTATEAREENYTFNEENAMANVQNAFEEGLKMLKAGDIPSAVLLFEAACQADPQNALAWQYLGTTQAENEHDSAAILALKKCLSLDANNLTAILALAVSYTNESREDDAFGALREWLSKNERYAHLVESSEPPLAEDGTRRRFTEIRDLYIKAARLSASMPDPDVQCGLGVLFNLAGEYDKAVDCFSAALQVRPEDALLWNRLGATLANGNRPEEAVSAYRRALELSPGFLRSRFNLGISCINLKAFQEAAEHFLTVLNSQNSGRGPVKMVRTRALTSANVWSSLRLVVSLMGRHDLYEHVDQRNLSRLNREFNMEF